VKQIKRFSHWRKTEEIEQYVHEHFTIGPDFAIDRPVSLFRLVSDGIARFPKQSNFKQLDLHDFESDLANYSIIWKLESFSRDRADMA
jgi:hypothetical protein